MGLWDKLKGEIIDIIDWTDSTNDTIIEDNLYNSQLSMFLKNKMDAIWNYKEEILERG